MADRDDHPFAVKADRLLPNFRQFQPVNLFGVIPGFGPLMPAWLIGYLIVAIPAVPLIKRATRIR